MAKSYYGYKKRDLDKSYIDWAGLTSTISDNLSKEVSRREEARAEIEQDHINTLDKLSEYETGLNTDANDFLTKGAYNAKNYQLSLNKLLKSGKLSVEDYKMKKQKVLNGFKHLNSAMKNYNTAFKSALDSGNDGSIFLAEDASKFLDFKNTELWTDPKSGELFLAKRGEDGTIDKSTIKPVRSITNSMNWQWDGFDPTTEISNKTKGLAKWKEAHKGGYLHVDDARLNPEFEKWKEATIKGLMYNDRKIASVLTEGVTGYSFTRDEEEASSNPNLILIKDDSEGVAQPQLTDAQKKAASDYLGREIEIRVGRQEEQSVYKKSAAEEKSKLMKKKQSEAFDRIDKAIQGDSKALESIARELDVGYRIEGGNLIITNEDGVDMRPIDLSGSHKEIGMQLASELGYDGEAYSIRDISFGEAPGNMSEFGDFSIPKGKLNLSDKANVQLISNALDREGTEQGKTDADVQRDVIRAIGSILYTQGVEVSPEIDGDGYLIVNGKNTGVKPADINVTEAGILQAVQNTINTTKGGGGTNKKRTPISN